MLLSLSVKCWIILHIFPNQLKNNLSQKNNENGNTMCFVLQKMALYICSIKWKDDLKIGCNVSSNVKRNVKKESSLLTIDFLMKVIWKKN